MRTAYLRYHHFGPFIAISWEPNRHFWVTSYIAAYLLYCVLIGARQLLFRTLARFLIFTPLLERNNQYQTHNMAWT
ncbi:hypothetical protein V495_06472 [Pseudogymnoascus sp. VKM F-4514 (FW-929)]|nr:hypothetical protein V495_06472 [Pseudogymnoascus sp. VKM F-4514 (FW-929)]